MTADDDTGNSANTDRLAQAIETLRQTWAPKDLNRRGLNGYEGDGTDFEAHARLRTCGQPGCGESTLLLVRRWHPGTASLPATSYDPWAKPPDTEITSQQPSYDDEPAWAACGIRHAKEIIATDRADPVGGPSGELAHYYQVDGYLHQPHATELPSLLVGLKRELAAAEDQRQTFDIEVHDGEDVYAGWALASLRRRMACAVGLLARIPTREPTGKELRQGSPEPVDLAALADLDADR